MEDQDHWWMAGVHRSVELIRRPARADILDFNLVQANQHGQLHVEVLVRGQEIRPQPRRRRKRHVKLTLFHDSQYVFSKHAIEIPDIDDNANRKDDIPCCWGPAKVPIWSESQVIPNEKNADDRDHTELSTSESTKGNATVHFQTVISNPQLWTAETPNLYTLVIEQHEDEGGGGNDSDGTIRTTTTQVESCRIGFRSVEVTPKGVLHVNGRAITICGINRHEHDPDHGKVVSLERMKQDIIVLK